MKELWRQIQIQFLPALLLLPPGCQMHRQGQLELQEESAGW